VQFQLMNESHQQSQKIRKTTPRHQQYEAGHMVPHRYKPHK
jgi:carboxypeptidase C (cathepsin A)